MITLKRNKMGRSLMYIQIFLIVCVTGCFQEFDDCPENGFRLHFETLNPKHFFPDIVQNINLYFFTNSGKQVVQYRLTRDDLELPEGNVFIENFDHGYYKVVAVVNEIGNFTTTGGTFEDLITTLNKKEVSSLPFLYSGAVDFTYQNEDKGKTIATVKLFKHTNHINLDVIFNNKENKVPLNVCIEGINGAFHHASHSCPDDIKCTFLPENETDGTNEVKFRINTLRLWLTAEVKLIIECKENHSFPDLKLDIIDILRKVKDTSGSLLYNTDEKLEYNDEYDIVITLDNTWAIIGLSINGWDIIVGEIPVRK